MTATVHCIISAALASVIGRPAINTPDSRSVSEEFFCSSSAVPGTPEVRCLDSAAHEIFADFYHLWDCCSDGANDMCPY